MKRNQLIALSILVIGAWSCKNDDNGGLLEGTPPDPPRPLSEVAPEDDAKIRAYLESHFYNYEDFENPASDFDYEIVINTIEGENSEKTPLSEQVEFIDVPVSSSAFRGLEEESNINHRLYYLLAEKSQEGKNPSVADSVFLKYKGFRLDNFVFDTNLTWFDLPGVPDASGQIGGRVRGFAKGLTFFKDGEGVMENSNGTFKKLNSGVGLIIMPSGLAYFNNTTIGESFAPIIFSVNLLEANEADHDRDGIPSILEDINKNEILLDDDGDEDRAPNYLDFDDDQDGIPTIEEIELDADGNFVGFKDTDGDGISDHLDNDN